MGVDDILKRMKKNMGGVPEYIKILAKIYPKAVNEHYYSREFALEGGAIPPKYKLLIALASSITAGALSSVKAHTRELLQKGVSKKEILETMMIARYELASKGLFNSLPGLKELKGKKVRDGKGF